LTPEAERWRGRVLDSLQKAPPQLVADNASSKPGAGAPTPGTMADHTGELGEENLRVLNHEFLPLVDDCYQQARERNPQLRGMLALDVKLAGADDVGGIIETLEPAQEGNQVDDEELFECVRQSAFSIQFPAPTKSSRHFAQLTIPLEGQRAEDAGR
jgi:hypothetical protein